MFVKMYTMGMGRLCGVGKDQKCYLEFNLNVPFRMFSEIQHIYFKTVYVCFIYIDLLECIQLDPFRSDLKW